jgi:hypothetical protein
MKRQISLVLAVLFAVQAHVWSAVHIQQNNGQNYTAVLSNGSTTQKYDIVFVGDGFTANDQTAFNNAVDAAVAAMRARPGYAETMCGFNVWRVNVVSSESGIDHPKDNISRNTELDCRYGNPANNEAERCIRSDSSPKCYEAAAYAPDFDAIFVLVNDMQWGGCAGDLVFSSISTGFDGIITHELGHKIGALADEYECYLCDGSDDGRTYSGDERPAANVTTNMDRTTTKWNDLINPTTAIPTTADNPSGVVGLFAGGDYYAQGIFRPQFTCHMRTTSSAFCAVCARKLQQVLRRKCTPCELDPQGFWCIYGDLLKNVHVRYRQPFRIRWPGPVCLTCPPFQRDNLEDEVTFKLTGLEEGFKVQVLDEEGRPISEAEPTNGRVEFSFAIARGRNFSIDLISGARASGQELNIAAEMTRNGSAVQLPAVQ